MSQVMVLDMTYLPVNVVGWQKAMTLVFTQKAEVLEETDQSIRTVKLEMKVPSVIRLVVRTVSKRHREVKFNRANVIKRDGAICQYCGNRFPVNELTLDHVIPKSKGGVSSWNNVVACCKPCNLKKGDKLLKNCGMELLRKPKQPVFVPYVSIGSRNLETWRKYVPYIEVDYRVE